RDVRARRRARLAASSSRGPRAGVSVSRVAALIPAYQAAATVSEVVRGTRAVTLDADGQHYPDEIPRLLAALEPDPRAIVVGVRQKDGQEIAALARFGNWVADELMTHIAGQTLPDTQS